MLISLINLLVACGNNAQKKIAGNNPASQRNDSTIATCYIPSIITKDNAPPPPSSSTNKSTSNEATCYAGNPPATAQFPGGADSLRHFLERNIKYPFIAQENGIQGRVIVQITIRKTGYIENVRILRHINPALDNEAIRVIKKMPRWIPAYKGKNKVKSKCILPILFKLQE